MILAVKPLALLVALAGAWPLAAETAATGSDPGQDRPVNLSPFVASASAAGFGRYGSLESTSAGRVRTDIMDSPQSVSVITSEVLQDVAPGRIVDAARYVAGVSDSTLPTSWERTNVRGFQADGRTVDGITYGAYPGGGFQNLDPAIIDRIEVVKGPNSILAPQPTSPGGTINLATKQPQFRDFGLFGLQSGRFEANSGFVDVNRSVGARLAIRFVASVRDWEHWWRGAYVHSTTLMPTATYRFPTGAQVTFQSTFTDWKAQNYFGLPIDPTSGTTTPAHLLAGVPTDLNVSGNDVFRATRQYEIKLVFTTGLWKDIQMRLAAAYNVSSQDGPQINTGPSTGGPGGSVDPLTGFWNPGLRYAAVPPYAPAPLAAPPTRTFTRSGVELRADPRQLNLQNDYACVLENGSVRSTTLAGFAYSDLRDDNEKAYNLSAPNLDIDHGVAIPWTRGTLNYSYHVSNRFLQGYVSESLALCRGRLILDAAESWQHYRESQESKITGAGARSAPSTALPSAGVVVKPAGNAVSLYYGYSRQSSANTPSPTGVSVPALSTADQHEFGARLKVGDNRLYLTVSHFAIAQDNFSTPNPANLAAPPPNPLLPPLFSDRKAHGWEFELRAHPAPGLSITAGYTLFRNRDPNNIEFRGVAEHAGGLLASYTFDRVIVPSLAGVRIAVGVDYLGNRPGDTATGFTAASTPSHLIPNQPTFYLGSRTLVNLTLAYDSKHHWGVQVNVDNLFDRDYLLTSATRFAVFPGPPRNFRGNLWYAF